MNKDPLLFPINDYIEETKKIKTLIGEKKVVYRFYKHIPYVSKPINTDYQAMNVMVPISIDDKPIDTSIAPILFSVGCAGFLSTSNKNEGMMPPIGPGGLDEPGGSPWAHMADIKNGASWEAAANFRGGAGGMLMGPGRLGDGGPMGGPQGGHINLALAAGYILVRPGCRGRDNQAEDGTYYGKAPAGIVDLKAAVKYIRHNKGKMPGNPEWIICTGSSGGGAMSTLLGTSGNSDLFDKYFEAIGAANERDDILGSASFSPIIDLDNADAAYEWQYGKAPYHDGQIENQELSRQLANLFAKYMSEMGYIGRNGFGVLTAENLADYLVKEYLAPGASRFLKRMNADEQKLYLETNVWLTWNGSSASFTFVDWVNHCGRGKPLPAFDDVNMSQAEPYLFGNTTENARHFTDFGLFVATGDSNAKVSNDIKKIVRLMNPVYYVNGNNPGCAPYWWIRHGACDTATSLPVVTNLATALENCNKNVNSRIIWDGGHCADDDPVGFIDWIAQITGYVC